MNGRVASSSSEPRGSEPTQKL